MPKTLYTTAVAAAIGAASWAASAQSATYVIDPTHTFVTFEVDHLGISTNRGRFDKKEGTVQFDRAGKTGKVELTIDTASINTGTAQFNRHLQSKDFFNSAEHPSAKFVADQFRFDGDKVSEVAGTLTLLGQTHPVVLKAKRFNCTQHPMLKREVCGGDFETTIQRSRWGMDYGLKMGMADDVKLLIQVEAIKQ
ncbi:MULTISPECIES: YceI family protein [Caldimonas]|uniref:YceI family protein n=1 Tax=Caldimonas TaxID=196013 RepID=UPI0003A807A8|nr:YceI family protein [Caldimonas manganoxidans]MCX7660469.1 YceI family protein [Caldimonas manganoxidans]GIX24003.1 MAG: polyisoprenoid-binding protein [Caldimonas sp.]